MTSERLCVSPETYTEPKTGTTHSTQTWYDCLWCNTRCSAEIFLLEHIIAKHRDQCRTPADPGCDPAPSRVSVEHQTDTATVRGGGMVSIGGPGGSREVGPLQIARCMQLLHVRRMVTNANECKSKKVKLCLTKDYTGTERIDENKYNYLPPSEQVNSILDMIHTQFLEEQLKHVLVILDYGTFSMHSIKEFSDNHVSKKVLQDFKDERFFLVNKQFNTVCTESELDMSSVHKIGNATSAYGDVDLVSFHEKSYKVMDLTYLFCDRWLSSELVGHFADLLNDQFYQSNSFTQYLYDVVDAAHFGEMMCRQFADVVNGQLILIVPVGQHDGEVFCGHKVVESSDKTHIVRSTHFALAVYPLVSNRVIYADTSGWAMPDRVTTVCSMVAQAFGKPPPTYNYCHHPATTDLVMNIHRCSEICSQLYPLQSCDWICGVATIVGDTLASLRPTGFHALFCPDTEEPESIDQVSYLRDISSYSQFLRLRLMQWIADGNIDVKLILRTHDAPRLLEDMNHDNDDVNPTLGEVSAKKNKHSDMDRSKHINPKYLAQFKLNLCTRGSTAVPLAVNFTNISDCIVGKPAVKFESKANVLRLVCTLPSGKKTTKSYPCSVEGKQDNHAVTSMQTFLDSLEARTWLNGGPNLKDTDDHVHVRTHVISGKVTCTNWPDILVSADLILVKPKDSSDQYQLRLFCLVTSGKTRSKFFKCSADGRGDLSAINEVEKFVNGTHFEQWLSGLAWQPRGEVQMGIPTRRLIDNLTFDTKLHLVKSKKLSLKITQDVDTLLVSNIDKSNGKQFHRPDEHIEIVETGDSEDIDPDTQAAVLVVTCSSKTDVCLGECGARLVDMRENKLCHECNLTLSGSTECSNCHSQYSSVWRDIEGQVCHTCYSYYSKHQCHRPHTLFSTESKIYHPHIKCGWKLKLVLYANDMSKWKIYVSIKNDICHPTEPVQENRRLTLGMKDKIDRARITGRTAPQQIYIAENQTNISTYNH